MTPTSLAVAVVPRTGKIIKITRKRRKLDILQNGVLHFVLVSKPIFRKRVTKIEFTQMKN